MSRGNAGFHVLVVLLIVLAPAAVMLLFATITLGVATFVLQRQCREAEMEAAACREEAGQDRQVARSVQEENAQLREMMGFAPSDDLETIQERFETEMVMFAPPGLPEDQKSYREAVHYLYRLCAASGEGAGEPKIGEEEEIRRIQEGIDRKATEQIDKSREDLERAREEFERSRKESDRLREELQKSTDLSPW